ncbi:UNKNOWN [Stylonychia lemnae]|uniref:Transmembrane protein n=1 Tax=Stylonychia lemnae TaxID=5949 RepID=A0A078B9G9_STYLE|nr:UNKNOWN [Stylonychia lemnae]|eukprot:CDW91059.1 UNKNOWN [Stylonychia lemnae]
MQNIQDQNQLRISKENERKVSIITPSTNQVEQSSIVKQRRNNKVQNYQENVSQLDNKAKQGGSPLDNYNRGGSDFSNIINNISNDYKLDDSSDKKVLNCDANLDDNSFLSSTPKDLKKLKTLYNNSKPSELVNLQKEKRKNSQIMNQTSNNDCGPDFKFHIQANQETSSFNNSEINATSRRKMMRKRTEGNPVNDDNESKSNASRARMDDAMKTKILQKMLNVSEYQINFSFKQFIKYIFYHLLFFYLGIFANLVIMITDSPQAVNNMSFWITTRDKISFFTQLFQWLSNLTIIMAWLQKYFKLSKNVEVNLNLIFMEQLYFYNFVVVMRIFIIAVRYGFTSEFRLQLLMRQKQEYAFIARDLLLPTWIELTPQGMETELEAVLWRNQIDESKFKLGFIEKLNDKLDQKLSSKDYYESNKFSMKELQSTLNGLEKTIKFRDQKIRSNEIILTEEMEMFEIHKVEDANISYNFEKKYDASLLLKEIALFSSAHQTSLKVFLIVATFGKLSLPFIIRGAMHGQFLLDWDSAIYTAIETLASSFFLLQNYIFLGAGHVDFQRRFYMIKYISSLINPTKQSLEIMYQISPTINLVDRASLHIWFQLRCCTMDFGQKYQRRIFVYSSVFLGMYLVYGGIILLSYFDFLVVRFSTIFNVYCLYDILLTFGVILAMFQYGALINEQFMEDKLQLIIIKQKLIDVKYSLDDLLSNKKQLCQYTKLFQKIIKNLKQTLKNKEAIQEKINEVIDEIDVIKERLEVEYVQRPLKIMGVTASFQLLNQIYTTLFTVGVAVAQKFYSRNS